jgi:hypothetical protein
MDILLNYLILDSFLNHWSVIVFEVKFTFFEFYKIKNAIKTKQKLSPVPSVSE